MGEFTALIRRAHDGDPAARDVVFRQLYEALQKLAHSHLSRSGRDALLDTSSLISETYLRLARLEGLEAADRASYLSYASQAMRSVIVDFARARATARRGGGVVRVTLNTFIEDSVAAGEEEVLSLDRALEELARLDERAAKVVELRYFGGLTETEVAGVLGLSERTVRRVWEKARLLLAASLAGRTG
jgi:RNA polymerase sigma factor (TIGR02999 family)